MKTTHWQNYNRSQHAMLDPALKEWLLYSGSFMQRLQDSGIREPSVEVLGQKWQFATSDEKNLLNVSTRTYVLVRDVIIKSQEAVWMVARTVFPAQTLTGKERQLAHLKNRSLGSVLFAYPSLSRSDFEITQLFSCMDEYQKINQITPLSESMLWARRSVFHVNHKPLLLTEVFMPEISGVL